MLKYYNYCQVSKFQYFMVAKDRFLSSRFTKPILKMRSARRRSHKINNISGNWFCKKVLLLQARSIAQFIFDFFIYFFQCIMNICCDFTFVLSYSGNITTLTLPAILIVIFWNFKGFQQGFDSLRVKQNLIYMIKKIHMS